MCEEKAVSLIPCSFLKPSEHEAVMSLAKALWPPLFVMDSASAVQIVNRRANLLP